MEIVGPVWFLGVDALVESVFFLVTLLVAITATRAYLLLRDARYRTLAWGFGALSTSYLILAAANAIVALRFRTEVTHVLEEHLEQLLTVGVIAHCILFLLGLIVLVVLYYDVRDWGLRALITALTLFSLILTGHLTTAFYLLAAILLGSVIARLWRQAAHRKKWLVPIGFTLVFIGEILFGILFLTPLMYVAAHLTALIGYSLILASNARALRR